MAKKGFVLFTNHLKKMIFSAIVFIKICVRVLVLITQVMVHSRSFEVHQNAGNRAVQILFQELHETGIELPLKIPTQNLVRKKIKS